MYIYIYRYIYTCIGMLLHYQDLVSFNLQETQMTSYPDLAAPLRWPMQAMKGAVSRVALTSICCDNVQR